MLIQILISCWTLFSVARGVQIQECASNRVIMEENTSGSLTCTGYTGTVGWQFKQPGAGDTVTTIGQCGSTCQLDSSLPTGFFTLTPLSDSSSRLDLSSSVTTKGNIDTEFDCGSAKCGLDIVVNAELGSLTVSLNTDNGWRVRGSVVITKVFSSIGSLYRCVWSRRHGTGQYILVSNTTLFQEPNPTHTDRSGSCDVTDSLPDTTGTYTYRVQVYPGATEKTDTSVVIESPPQPSITCTPTTGYVSEDADLSCTCSGSVGRPVGRLVWVRRDTNNVDITVKTGGDGGDRLPLTMRVNRTHNGNTLRCDVDWVSVTTGPSYVINVTYGPDSVRIPENRTFYTDSTGSRDLTLTCNPRDVSPTSGLTYSWTGPCAGVTSDRCVFSPRPPDVNSNGDVGVTIQCRVTNPRSSKTEQDTFTLQLKYPPRSAPHILGYTDGHILYQGQPLSINCTANGGDPHVTSVTLTCTDHPQAPSNGQSSSLRVTSLNASDHGAVCTCSAVWVKPDLYSLTDSKTLTVYYPPSLPDVRRTDGLTRPYLEGDNVTLTCTVTSRGHPAANLTWSGHEKGKVTGDDVMRSTLRLVAVGRGDNQKNITCHAVNDFTQHEQRDFSDLLTLQVYYGPDVTVTSSDSNTCIMLPDHVTCTVLEGQRVHFRSHADSNPDPQLYVWQAPDGSDLDLDPGSDLDIVSINRTHSGVYRVQVTTSKPDVTDSRLPLTSHRDLTVLVNYTASYTTFGINNTKNFTVNENDPVTFDCQSRGRPTPELQLIQRDIVLVTAEGGELSVSEVSTALNHTVTAQCHNTGLYTCNANNGVGAPLQDTVQLYVNCKPRDSDQSTGRDPPEANYVDTPVFVEFRLVAFPVPDIYNFSFHVNDSDTAIPDSIVLTATCDAMDTDYDVTCNVTISDVTNPKAEGTYTFTAANAFGQEDFLFKVNVNGTVVPTGELTTKLNIAAIAGGIGAALLVIAIVFVAVFIVRRRKEGTGRSSTKLAETNGAYVREEPEMTVNDLYGTTPGEARKDADEEVMIVNTAYVSSAELSTNSRATPRNAYEDVELNSSTSNSKVLAGKDLTTLTASTSDDASNLYATVNKQSTQAPNRPGPLNDGKQRPDVKPKPTKTSKPGKPKDKPTAKKTTKQDEKQLLRTGEYSNVGIAPLTMSPAAQEGSVYENYAFQQEESKREKPHGENDSRTVNDDGLVYTTVAFSENQLKKAEEPPPERETTEYAGIDFSRKAV